MISEENTVQPVALTIAGFDPSGGAGIVADIKTFAALGCIPVASVTSLTFQNSAAVFGAAHQSAEVVRQQVNSILEGSHIAGAKTGMLPTADIVREVVQLFRETNLPAPVVDPVMRSSSGYDLIEADAWDLLVSELMPLARVITPNIPEAERITGLEISDVNGMRRAAGAIREMGARAVLIKGGHLGGQEAEEALEPPLPLQAIDVLDDGEEVTVFCREWIDGPPTRGTGCMLSSAIAACLASGMSLEESVEAAKRFVAVNISKQQKRG
ncbi:MAG: bifunctional hydroxymethylpyrimidine kinase/phosphomethylpyrimidine kinase [Pyrinomonadaceae bacterium]